MNESTNDGSMDMSFLDISPAGPHVPNDHYVEANTSANITSNPSQQTNVTGIDPLSTPVPNDRLLKPRSQNTASFQHGPWPTPSGPGIPRSMQVQGHAVPRQRHPTPSVPAIQARHSYNPDQLKAYQLGSTQNGLQQNPDPIQRGTSMSHLYDPDQQESDTPQLPGARKHMLIHHNNNSTTSHPAQVVSLGSTGNGRKSTVQQASATQTPLNLAELHVRYKNMLSGFHELPPQGLRYLQQLKIVLQQNGLIRNSARNVANRHRMPNNGSPSSVPRPTGAPQISGLSNVQTQEKTKRKAKQANLSQSSHAFDESLIAPQPKRACRVVRQIEDAATDRTESWTIGGGEETLVKPRGLIKHFVPPDTILSVISKDAGHTYICASAEGEDRTYMTLLAGQVGLMASYQVKAKEEGGVPREHIKIAIFDDRVGFQGPTAGISETGDVISLAKGHSTLKLPEAGNGVEKNRPEHPSVTLPLIETGSQRNSPRPASTASPGENNRNPSKSVESSTASSDKNSDAPSKSSPNTEALTINEKIRSPLTTNTTVQSSGLDLMHHEPFTALPDKEYDDLFEDEVAKPASCTDTTMQAPETALKETEAGEKPSSSSPLTQQQQMEEPAVAALPAEAAVGEYPPQMATILRSNGAVHNETSNLSSHAVQTYSNYTMENPSNAVVLAQNAAVNNEGPYESGDEFFDFKQWGMDHEEAKE